MGKFKDQCPDCKFDLVAIHWYGVEFEDFKSYVNKWAGFGKPLSITEFGCWVCMSSFGLLTCVLTARTYRTSTVLTNPTRTTPLTSLTRPSISWRIIPQSAFTLHSVPSMRCPTAVLTATGSSPRMVRPALAGSTSMVTKGAIAAFTPNSYTPCHYSKFPASRLALFFFTVIVPPIGRSRRGSSVGILFSYFF